MPPWRRKPWAWAAAIALHVAVLLFVLLFVRAKPPLEQETPPGVAVVFDNGGAAQTAAPPAQRHGPSSVAQMPRAAPPPPPPPAQAQSEPEVNLNTPELPPAPRVVQAPPRPRAAPAPHDYVMMDGMSYGNPAPPAPPQPRAQTAMNMSLPESDAEAVNAPELTIKGNIGADWQAELTAWVNAHKYYPQAALEQGQQGSVRIEFTVDRAGNVTGLHLLGGSGSVFLDQAWLGLFEDNQLPPFPPGTKSDKVTIDATMHYELVQ
jgi:protein TonB